MIRRKTARAGYVGVRIDRKVARLERHVIRLAWEGNRVERGDIWEEKIGAGVSF
jgi:hypothetical protein